MPRITAAMIVRNEERFLPGCLASLRQEVDEIVIVDTGSDDRSREIALDRGAVVIDHPWRSDFAEARNVGLDHATGDWILYIDADERLVVPEPGALRRAVALPDAVAGRVRFRPRVAYTPYREIRLFRRDARIRFRGRIHETAHPDIGKVALSDGLRLADFAVGIEHFGYEGDLAHKHARNLPLLEAAVGDEPGLDHAKRVLRRPGNFTATLHFCDPFDPRDFPGRKAIAAEARARVAAAGGDPAQAPV